MSSVASSNSSNASDGASTTASSTGSVPSDASSVASAASAASSASGTSTAPSSVNSANPDTSAAGGESGSDLKRWYDDQLKSTEKKENFEKFLKASQNPTVPSKGLKATVEDWLEDSHEGVWKTENGTEIIAFNASEADEGVKVIKVGEHEYTCKWTKAAPGAGSSIQYVDATNSPASDTATKTQKTMPSLAPFLKLNEPEWPKRPEWYQDWFKTAKPAPSMPIADFDLSYGIVNAHKDEKELSRTDCSNYDRNDKVVLDALMKGWSHFVFAGW
jgi:hypothetical protein